MELTNNEIIGYFMGIEKVNLNQFDIYRLTQSPYSTVFTKSHSQYLDFNKSYDWLIPVIKKIQELGFSTKHLFDNWTNIEEFEIFIDNVLTHKSIKNYGNDCIYQTVLEFILIYNNRESYKNKWGIER